jgi:hypothetical protein
LRLLIAIFFLLRYVERKVGRYKMSLRLSVEGLRDDRYLDIEAPVAEGAVHADLEVRTARCFGLLAPRGWIPLEIEGPRVGEGRQIIYINPEEVSRFLAPSITAGEVSTLSSGQLKVALHIGALVSKNGILSDHQKAHLREEIATTALNGSFLFGNQQFLENLIRIDPDYLFELPGRLQTEGLWRTAILQKPELIQRAPRVFKRDEALFEALVQKDGRLIAEADEFIRDNSRIVLLALRQNFDAIDLINKRTDRWGPHVLGLLEYLKEATLNVRDPDIRDRILNCGTSRLSLYVTTDHLRYPNIRRLVEDDLITALARDDYPKIDEIFNGSPGLKNDPILAIKILEKYPNFFTRIGSDLKNNVEFLTEYFLRFPEDIEKISKEKCDEVFANILNIPNLGERLQALPPRIGLREEMMSQESMKKCLFLEFIQRVPSFFQGVPVEYRADLQFMRDSLRRNPDSFEFFSEEFRNSRSFIIQALEFQPSTLSFITDISVRREVIRQWLEIDKSHLAQIPWDVQVDLEPLIGFVNSDPELIKHFKAQCFENEEFVENFFHSFPFAIAERHLERLFLKPGVLKEIAHYFTRHLPLFLQLEASVQNRLMTKNLQLIARFLQLTMETRVEDEVSLIEGKRYAIKPIPEEISAQFLEAAQGIREGASWESLLDVKVRAYVNTLPLLPFDGRRERGQLYREDALLDLETAISRIRGRTPFLGTPVEADREHLEMFYTQIKTLLSRIDEKISEDTDKDVEEKKQIIHALGVCGGGWQAQFEEMETSLCDIEEGTPFSVIVARLLSVECKTVIQGLNLEDPEHPRDVHLTNGMLKIVHAYVGGPIPIDHLQYLPANPVGFVNNFFSRFSPVKICEMIADLVHSKPKFSEEFAKFRDEKLFENSPLTTDIMVKLREKEDELRSLIANYEEKQSFYNGLRETVARISNGVIAQIPAERLEEMTEDDRRQVITERRDMVEHKMTEAFKLLGGALNEERLTAALRRCFKNSEGVSLITDEEINDLLRNRDQYKEIQTLRLRIQPMTGLKQSQIFSSSYPTRRSIWEAYERNRQKVIDETVLENFTEVHMDETGRYKPSGIAIILKKLGFLKEI